MKLSSLLLPKRILSERSRQQLSSNVVEEKSVEELAEIYLQTEAKQTPTRFYPLSDLDEQKAHAFSRIFGIDPTDNKSPFNIEGEILTKQEIINRMISQGIISLGFLGRVKAEILLKSRIYSHKRLIDPYKEWYKFKKMRDDDGNKRFQLRYNSSGGFGY